MQVKVGMGHQRMGISFQCIRASVLACAAALLVGQTANAGTYSYSFDAEIVSEEFYAVHLMDLADPGAGIMDGWQDGPTYGFDGRFSDLHTNGAVSGELTVEPGQPDSTHCIFAGAPCLFEVLTSDLEAADPTSGDAELRLTGNTVGFTFDFIAGTADFLGDADARPSAPGFSGFADKMRASFVLSNITRHAPVSVLREVTPSAVPLPAGPALLLAGLAGLSLFRRRRSPGPMSVSDQSS